MGKGKKGGKKDLHTLKLLIGGGTNGAIWRFCIQGLDFTLLNC